MRQIPPLRAAACHGIIPIIPGLRHTVTLKVTPSQRERNAMTLVCVRDFMLNYYAPTNTLNRVQLHRHAMRNLLRPKLRASERNEAEPACYYQH